MKKFIHLAQPLFGAAEKKEISEALDSGWVTLGPRVRQFEEDFAQYVGAKHAIAVSSCTAALHLSFLVAGIGQGNEVITTPFTFPATVNTILHVGAMPVLVDIDSRTFNLDPDKIEEKITSKTKAIVPVHYAGQPVEMSKILALARKHKLKVIEDAAHAVGAEYKGKKIGSIGDLTCFSFHPIKNISTGDGGMITTNKKKYADQLILWRLHGMSKEAWKRHTKAGSWRYDILLPGYKYNLTDIQAAIGLHQLKNLERFISKRQKYAALYDQALAEVPELTIPHLAKNVRHARNLYPLMINAQALKVSRDELIELLKGKNIGSSVYFVPLNHFSYYQKELGWKKGSFPVAESVSERIICLPLYPKMTAVEVQYVIKTLVDFVGKNRKAFSWSFLDFDTDLLGFKTARIESILTDKVDQLAEIIKELLLELKDNEIQYATCRVRATNFPLIHALEKAGFNLVDGKVCFNLPLDGISSESWSSFVRPATEDDIEELKKVGREIFIHNRLHNDPFIPKEKSDELYERWIENSVRGKQADLVLTWNPSTHSAVRLSSPSKSRSGRASSTGSPRRGSGRAKKKKILGFITLKKDGYIPLVGVAEGFRNQGIGKKLLQAALSQFKKWGLKTARIDTQMTNIASTRAFEACGFRLVDSYLTFRWKPC